MRGECCLLWRNTRNFLWRNSFFPMIFYYYSVAHRKGIGTNYRLIYSYVLGVSTNSCCTVSSFDIYSNRAKWSTQHKGPKSLFRYYILNWRNTLHLYFVYLNAKYNSSRGSWVEKVFNYFGVFKPLWLLPSETDKNKKSLMFITKRIYEASQCLLLLSILWKPIQTKTIIRKK